MSCKLLRMMSCPLVFIYLLAAAREQGISPPCSVLLYNLFIFLYFIACCVGLSVTSVNAAYQ